MSRLDKAMNKQKRALRGLPDEDTPCNKGGIFSVALCNKNACSGTNPCNVKSLTKAFGELTNVGS
tara:strand:- start:327 stop:521 length:195 start_codon:yes stop_codon:yes gene_type:complete